LAAQRLGRTGYGSLRVITHLLGYARPALAQQDGTGRVPACRTVVDEEFAGCAVRDEDCRTDRRNEEFGQAAWRKCEIDVGGSGSERADALEPERARRRFSRSGELPDERPAAFPTVHRSAGSGLDSNGRADERRVRAVDDDSDEPQRRESYRSRNVFEVYP